MDVTIPCICPEKDGEPRHEADTVTLRDKLDFFSAASIRNSVVVLKTTKPRAGTAETMAVLAEQYLLRGVESWTLVDESGRPLPVGDDEIGSVLMKNVEAAMAVADEADALYQDVMLPLLLRVLTPSQPSRTESSTSPTNGSQRKRPKRSQPSSTTTIPTADIATTSSSLDGDSRLSLSSA